MCTSANTSNRDPVDGLVFAGGSLCSKDLLGLPVFLLAPEDIGPDGVSDDLLSDSRRACFVTLLDFTTVCSPSIKSLSLISEQNRTEHNFYWSEIHIQRIVTKTTH